jgi:hypothetical protein
VIGKGGAVFSSVIISRALHPIPYSTCITAVRLHRTRCVFEYPSLEVGERGTNPGWKLVRRKEKGFAAGRTYSSVLGSGAGSGAVRENSTLCFLHPSPRAQSSAHTLQDLDPVSRWAGRTLC